MPTALCVRKIFYRRWAAYCASACPREYPEGLVLLSGINLTLMIGPAVPIPVSKDVLDALTSIEVTSKTEGPSVFQLKFTVNKNSPLLTLFLLGGGASIPLVRVVIYVTIGGSTEVLIDGVMADHQMSPGGAGQSPSLTITGEDLTR